MIFDFIRIDKRGGDALWRQIYEQFAAAADSGMIAPLTRLPSIRELAEGLSVSRSPVENAYERLHLDGYLMSRPKSGYFIAPRRRGNMAAREMARAKDAADIRYDLSSGRIEAKSADLSAWRRCLRAALKREDEITSRGDPCGEGELRAQLAAYAYRARGVKCRAEEIVTASGTQQLLSLLCRALGGGGRAVLESPGFEQGERVLRDYGWEVSVVEESPDTAGRLSGADIFMEIGSKRPLRTLAQRTRRQGALAEWARENGRFIIEDDYNGELRYLARPIPAMQPLAPENIVYIGSFSQLLLPSVRVAYMALPPRLAESCAEAARFYDPTSSKVEQLALADYIREGYLERHLRRCRKLYLRKSRLFSEALTRTFGPSLRWRLLETSTAFALTASGAEELRLAALRMGIKIETDGGDILLSFASLPEEDIAAAVSALKEAWPRLGNEGKERAAARA